MNAQQPESGCIRNVSTKKYTRHYELGPYKLLQTLGEGEFGKVKLGVHPETGEETLRHPNIVKLINVVQTERYIGIILEYASGGELFEYILANRYLKEKDARKLFAQLISSVQYMHQKSVVHRDLKLENLLLDRNRNIIVTDFGFANHFSSESDDLMSTSCGSPCYAAPELVVNDGLYAGSAVDIWSCGVILYAMLCGYLPFDDDPSNPDGDNINLLYRYILSSQLAFPDFISDGAKDLLRKMLVPDPTKRCTISAVTRHPWLQEYWPLLQKDHDELEAEANAATNSIFPRPCNKQRKRLSAAISPPLARPAKTYGTYSFRHFSIGRTAAERFKQTGTVQFHAFKQHRAAEKLFGFFTNKTPKSGDDSSTTTDNAFPTPETSYEFRPEWIREVQDSEPRKAKVRPHSHIYGSIRRYLKGSRISTLSARPAQEDLNGQDASFHRGLSQQALYDTLHAPLVQQDRSCGGLEHIYKSEKTMRRQVFSSGKPKSDVASVPNIQNVSKSWRGTRSRTVDGLSSLAKAVTSDRPEQKIRLHSGAVDRSALTSRRPSQVLADVMQILQALGIDTKTDGYYKIKCSRQKAKTQLPRSRRCGIYKGFSHSQYSQASDILSENVDQLSADSSLASIKAVPTNTPSFLSGLLNDGDMSPDREPIYGNPSIDTGEEVRFVVEICRFRNLPGLYIVDIRRLRGPVWAYKFLYQKLLSLLDLNGKGGYITTGGNHHC
ncbi:hypothetical protein EC973_003628 [Apophysomyces ossiformis]|uniref:non-specific serine/threonine protein kinase n=1 Tax=Apophysomyces ossiformis TaxID=679940 RepID=A0A8H7BQL2_9FUNG|nr:hypothetical protein EC973_003628 [Apophysomyces ossiformis]